MSEHADLDALADALAEESDGRPLPEHLQTCPTCSAALAELRAALPAVASDLGALPAVPPVPADLSAPVAPTQGVAAATVLPEAGVTSLDSRRSGPRWLLPAGGIAAAAVLVVGGGLLLTSNATDSDRGTKAASTAGQLAITSSGKDYVTPQQVQSGVPGLLMAKRTAVDQAAPESAVAGSSTDRLARLRGAKALAACIASLTEPGSATVPLALDYASYQHRPALLVVLPDKKPSKVVVFIVGPGCTQTESDLYLYVRADRPSP